MSPIPFPSESMSLLLDGPIGPLEAAVDFPAPDAVRQPVVAVVCHPLSTEGGSMNNKVVTMAARGLRELGVSTVRFNFRCVGGSTGDFDHGEGEREDLRSVVDWVRSQRPADSIWLAGFSFGAYVSIRSAVELRATGLVSIAPPVGRWDFAQIDWPRCPWLVVQGEKDEIVDPQAVYRWIDTLKAPPRLIRIPQATHFFHRQLVPLREAVVEGVRPWLAS